MSMGLFSLLRSLLAIIGAIGITAIVIFAVGQLAPEVSSERFVANEEVVVVVPEEADILDEEEEMPPPKAAAKEDVPEDPPAQESKPTEQVPEEASTLTITAQAAEWEITRTENPYGIPARDFSEINEEARAALVNIFCRAGGSLGSITASGVFINSNGVILTNAHVAQYILLAQSKKANLECTVRTGAPARDRFVARVLYVPPSWVREHAHDLNNENALGTGEHDWALLYVIESTDGSTLPSSFPFLPFDTRVGIGFTGDSILIASYPAGFLGGTATISTLYPASTVTTIQSLLTFDSGVPEIFSLGGSVAAQSGSSGGAVVNGWGYLIGLITTMSNAETTAERDLRAVALNYVDADLRALTGHDLQIYIRGDLAQKSAVFMSVYGVELTELLLEQVK